MPIKSTTTVGRGRRKKRDKKQEVERKRKKGKLIELQKPNIEAGVYNNNEKCDWKKNKSLIRFHSANKIDNYNKERTKKEKNPKEP